MCVSHKEVGTDEKFVPSRCPGVFCYLGEYDEDVDIRCITCQIRFNHVVVKKGWVVLRHRCTEIVEIWDQKFAPCVLAVHDESVPHIGEMIKSLRSVVSYGSYFGMV